MRKPGAEIHPQVILHNQSAKKQWDDATGELHAYTDEWLKSNPCSLGYQVTGIAIGNDLTVGKKSWNGKDPLFMTIHSRGEWVHRYTFMPGKIVVNQRTVGSRTAEVFIVVPVTMGIDVRTN